MLGDDAGGGREDSGGAGAAEQMERVGVLFGGFVGRIEIDDVKWRECDAWSVCRLELDRKLVSISIAPISGE